MEDLKNACRARYPITYGLLDYTNKDGKLYVGVCGLRAFRVIYYENEWWAVNSEDIVNMFTKNQFRTLDLFEDHFSKWQPIKKRNHETYWEAIRQYFTTSFDMYGINIRLGGHKILACKDVFKFDWHVSAPKLGSFLLAKECESTQIIAQMQRILPLPIAEEIMQHIRYICY